LLCAGLQQLRLPSGIEGDERGIADCLGQRDKKHAPHQRPELPVQGVSLCAGLLVSGDRRYCNQQARRRHPPNGFLDLPQHAAGRTWPYHDDRRSAEQVDDRLAPSALRHLHASRANRRQRLVRPGDGDDRAHRSEDGRQCLLETLVEIKVRKLVVLERAEIEDRRAPVARHFRARCRRPPLPASSPCGPAQLINQPNQADADAAAQARTQHTAIERR